MTSVIQLLVVTIISNIILLSSLLDDQTLSSVCLAADVTTIADYAFVDASDIYDFKPSSMTSLYAQS